jgi:hypothetical protein
MPHRQVTKACFQHSHATPPLPPTASTSSGPPVTVGTEFPERTEFVRAVHDRARQDGVELKTFVDLGKLSRRARFAMCCSHKSKINAPKSKRCTYSFVAIEYEGVGWCVVVLAGCWAH